MYVELFTDKAREAMVETQEIAQQRRNSQLKPEHVLLALVRQADGIVPCILARLQANA